MEAMHQAMTTIVTGELCMVTEPSSNDEYDQVMMV